MLTLTPGLFIELFADLVATRPCTDGGRNLHASLRFRHQPTYAVCTRAPCAGLFGCPPEKAARDGD